MRGAARRVLGSSAGGPELCSLCGLLWDLSCPSQKEEQLAVALQIQQRVLKRLCIDLMN